MKMTPQTPLKILKCLLFTSLLSLAACGGDFFGEDEGTITGTGISGTAAEGAPLSNATISAKSAESSSIATTTALEDGTYSFSGIRGNGPFLLRADRGDQDFYYSIGFREDRDRSNQITVNIHPFTDLILRNWFEFRGFDIDETFASGLPANMLPSQTDIELITNEIDGIIRLALAEFTEQEVDLFNTPFAADQTGFDAFLDVATVSIQDDSIVVSIVFNDFEFSAEFISSVDLSKDFTTDNDTPPTTPTEVIGASTQNSEGNPVAIVTWQPSTDDKGVAGYAIYRDNEQIDTSPYPVYVDENTVAGTTYTYQIAAIDGREQQSELSSLINIEVGAADITPPTSATELTLEEADGTLILRWSQDAIQDVYGFRIVRNNVQEYAYTNSTSFIDSNIENGTVYCYGVVTFDLAGNESAESEQVCAVAGEQENAQAKVSFHSDTVNVFEQDNLTEITIARLGEATAPLSVDFIVTAGTAIAGEDYIVESGILTWEAEDNTAKQITVHILADDSQEEDETLFIELVARDDSPDSIGQIARTTLNIINSDVNCETLADTEVTSPTTIEGCVYVESDIRVSGTTLTINPGAKLIFRENTALNVTENGTLKILGSSENTALLTGLEKTAGFWDGIQIESDQGNQIQNAVIEYGGGAGNINSANILLTSGANLDIDHTLVRFSESYGISKGETESFTLINNNIITQNRLAPIRIDINSVGQLNNSNQYSGNDQDFIDIYGENIVDEQTWQRLDVAYRVNRNNLDDDEEVREINTELTIEPGVTVEFAKDIQFRVDTGGELRAIGNEDNKITFTGVEKTLGFWDSLSVSHNLADNILEHVVIEYAGENRNDGTAGGLVVYGLNSKLTMNNVVVQYSPTFAFEIKAGPKQLVMNQVSLTNNAKSVLVTMENIPHLRGDNDFSGNDIDFITLSNEDIDKDAVIPNLGYPYLTVPCFSGRLHYIDADLTFEPGVIFRFIWRCGYQVRENGSINAIGTPEAPISFIGNDDFKGAWNGITFDSSNSEKNKIDYAIFENSGMPDEYRRSPEPGQVVLVGNTRIDITNSVFRHSQNNGIWRGSDVDGDTTTGNTFEDIDGENILIEP